MLVPQACGRQNQIAFVHRALFALYRGEAAFTFHHKAHCTGCVAMVGCNFTRQDQLHAHIDVWRGHELFNAMARVAQNQDAAFGFFNGRQFTCAHQLGANVFVVPDKWLCSAGWFATRQKTSQLRPQGRNRQRSHVGNVVCGEVFKTAKRVRVIGGGHVVGTVQGWRSLISIHIDASFTKP